MREVVKSADKYKIKSKVLCIHQANQSNDLEYFRIVVPDDDRIRNQILNECHSVTYVNHPGAQRTLARVKQYFSGKGKPEMSDLLWNHTLFAKQKRLIPQYPMAVFKFHRSQIKSGRM